MSMLSYTLLFLIIAVVILVILRFSKPRYPNSRKQQEPFVGVHQIPQDNEPGHEGIIGEPRIVHEDSIKPAPVDNPVIQASQFSTSLNQPVDPSVEKPQCDVEPDEQAAEVIIINLIAETNRPYQGHELLQTILNKGFRYGKWHIFHYHAQPLGRGPILFSLASSVVPGTFDLAKIDSFSSPGLTLFMSINHTDQLLKTLEKCLLLADQITRELGGKVCDEQRNPVVLEKLQEWQEKCKAA